MDSTQLLLQWVSENANKLIAGMAMALALVSTVKAIYREEEKKRLKEKMDIEFSQTHFLQESFKQLLEDKLHPMQQTTFNEPWSEDRMIFRGGQHGDGRTTTRGLGYIRDTITSGSCAIQVYPKEDTCYERKQGSWEPVKVEPAKPKEPLRLFCSCCNGYTYNDSHGSCINCGHVREKVIEPIYSKE